MTKSQNSEIKRCNLEKINVTLKFRLLKNHYYGISKNNSQVKNYFCHWLFVIISPFHLIIMTFIESHNNFFCQCLLHLFIYLLTIWQKWPSTVEELKTEMNKMYCMILAGGGISGRGIVILSWIWLDKNLYSTVYCRRVIIIIIIIFVCFSGR